jgi:hypothetical protein
MRVLHVSWGGGGGGPPCKWTAIWPPVAHFVNEKLSHVPNNMAKRGLSSTKGKEGGPLSLQLHAA